VAGWLRNVAAAGVGGVRLLRAILQPCAAQCVLWGVRLVSGSIKGPWSFGWGETRQGCGAQPNLHNTIHALRHVG
jgi:hypothetical protein